MKSKEEFDALNLEVFKEGPNKVQFHMEVVKIKTLTVRDAKSGNYEKSVLFVNTKTLTMYFDGIAKITIWN